MPVDLGAAAAMEQLEPSISMICNAARQRVRTNKRDFNAHLSINYITHS